MRKRKPQVYARIEDDSPTFERISVEDVERGLGAVAERFEHKTAASPVAIAALRRKLAGDLISTGGRPSRKEAVSLKKIPVTAEEARILDELAKLVREDGHVKATPAQIAGLLLHDSLEQFAKRLEGHTPGTAPGGERLHDSSDDEEMLEEILEAAASAKRQLEQLRPVARKLLSRMRAGKGIESDGDL